MVKEFFLKVEVETMEKLFVPKIALNIIWRNFPTRPLLVGPISLLAVASIMCVGNRQLSREPRLGVRLQQQDGDDDVCFPIKKVI